MMSSSAVNRPTDPKVKEADVNAKLQLYGIYSAFANGKVPSNKQIDVAMNSALESRALASPSKKLSTEGQHLVADLRHAIEQAKILLLTKNEGNLIQDFIWQTGNLGGGDAKRPGAPIDKATAKQHGNQALEGLRTLGTLIITNGQFRKLLSDATILLRDIAGDTAQKAASKVKPNEDQLAQIDAPADDNTWHEAPDLSRGNIRNQIQSRVPIGKKDLQDAAGDATQAADPNDSRDPADTANLAAQDQQQGTNSGVDAQKGAKTGVQNLRNKMSGSIPDEHKQKARDYRDRSSNYFKQKMPQDRRDQTIWRLKKMVVEIQSHSDYQQAIDTLLRLAEEYTGHGRNFAQQSGGTVKGAHTDDSLTKAEADLKTLLERFANGTSFDDLIDSINTIYRDAERDPELRNWFKSIDAYIRKCLQQQGYILQDAATERWNELYDHGNFLLRDRYRNHTDRITDEFRFLANQFDEDPQNKAFANSMQKMFNELGNDENGKPTFKPHLVKDLTEVIIPACFEHIRYVPIPRIEYSDPMMDAVVENLIIEGDNLAPNTFEFGTDNHWNWGRKSIQNSNKNKMLLAVTGVQMDLRDVSYYIKKKEGFPSVTDRGVMDIFLGGSGLSFKIGLETADKTDRAHFAKINTVVVDIKNMNIKLKQSNHKLLFGLFKPLLFKVIRPVIQKVAEKQIREQFAKLDAMAYKVKIEADRAADEARRNPDPENIQNIYQRYFTAFQDQLQKAQKKKDNAAGDKQVNVAMTQQDSIFKNISLPGGISTKATEYKELAAKGDKWESPVFSIGSSMKSSSLPAVGDVSRKPHNVNKAGVGGLSNGTTGGNNGGFANQVDNAFSGDSKAGGLSSGAGMTGAGMPSDAGLTSGSGMTSGAGMTSGSGITGTTGTTGVSGIGNSYTTLGRDNPVFHGDV